MIKVGLIGCGAIGAEVARAIDGEIPQLRLSLILDREKTKIDVLMRELRRKPEIASSIQQLVEKTDLVVEAASSKVVGEVLRCAMEQGKDVLVMSIGGVLEHLDLLERIRKEGKCTIFLPSGAIAGLDGLSAAREKEIESILLTTSKPPQALAGAPYVHQHNIDLKNINKPTLIFEGSAGKAVKAFPKNINVSAALSLAGIGMEKTRVRIIADPTIRKNAHRIQINGVFGEMEVMLKNLPSPTNPKTSYLAALSAVATLKKMVNSVKIGT